MLGSRIHIYLIKLGNTAFVSKVTAPKCIPTTKYENAHCSISSPNFETVIFSYMPICSMFMASHGGFLCIYLFTNKSEHLFMLSAIHVSSSLKQVSCISLLFYWIACFSYWLVEVFHVVKTSIHQSFVKWLFSLSTDFLKLRDKTHMSLCLDWVWSDEEKLSQIFSLAGDTRWRYQID